jgi:hypothetical protein
MVLEIDNTSDVLTEHSFNLFTYFVRELCMHVLLDLTTKNNCQIFLDLRGQSRWHSIYVSL